MRNRFRLYDVDGGTSDQPSGVTVPMSDMGLYDLPPVLWRRRTLIAVVVGVVMVAVTCITLFIPNKYRSCASILPSGDVDQLSDIKSLVGLGMPSGKAQNSSTLFPVILESETIRDAVLNRTYSYSVDGTARSVKLQDYFEEGNPDKLRARLAAITAVSQDKKTGVISLETETKSPALSRAILTGYLEELESFNVHKRRSQAQENARYLARQTAEKESALRAAEDSLEQFQNVNRNWSASTDPELAKIVLRKQREVDVLAQAYLYLHQQYEVALFEAQKDIPIVQILDAPSLPTVKSSPRRLLLMLTGAVSAFFGTTFWILVVDVRRRQGRSLPNTSTAHSQAPILRSVRLRGRKESVSKTNAIS